jgi:CDP-diglyceride synthetase
MIKINWRYTTPPMERTTLTAVLIISGIIFMTGATVFSPNIFAWLLGLAIYSIVVVISILINNYLRKLAKNKDSL